MKILYLYNYITVTIFILFNYSYGGCGNCPGDKQQIIKEQNSISNNFLMHEPLDGIVEGLIIASCGKCNLNTKDKRCDLKIKIGDKIFSVNGSTLHDHGDAHGPEGFCNAVRIARARGIIKKDIFHADSFKLIEN